LASLRHVNPFK